MENKCLLRYNSYFSVSIGHDNMTVVTKYNFYLKSIMISYC